MSYEFHKNDIDKYLKEVAKIYRKAGKMPAEIIIIGGGSVMLNYGFRTMTNDIDAYIQASSTMKDAIQQVGNKYDLPYGWLNEDFKNTSSFTPRLAQYSQYYRTFSNIVSVRTVSAEHLVAMKLMSGREYKSDFSDIVGILAEHQERGEPLSLEQIRSAVCDLYDSWERLPEQSQAFINNLDFDHAADIYQQTQTQEKQIKEGLLDFERGSPGKLNSDNIDTVISQIQKELKASDLAEIREDVLTTKEGPQNLKKK